MPYTNEHSARLTNPDLYRTCRRTSRTSDGRRYDIVTCQRKDNVSKWEEQSYRYPIEHWSSAEARAHAKKHNAIKFEAAEMPTIRKEDLPEGKFVPKRAIMKAGSGILIKEGIIEQDEAKSRLIWLCPACAWIEKREPEQESKDCPACGFGMEPAQAEITRGPELTP